jgi:hypothetical protein
VSSTCTRHAEAALTPRAPQAPVRKARLQRRPRRPRRGLRRQTRRRDQQRRRPGESASHIPSLTPDPASAGGPLPRPLVLARRHHRRVGRDPRRVPRAGVRRPRGGVQRVARRVEALPRRHAAGRAGVPPDERRRGVRVRARRGARVQGERRGRGEREARRAGVHGRDREPARECGDERVCGGEVWDTGAVAESGEGVWEGEYPCRSCTFRLLVWGYGIVHSLLILYRKAIIDGGIFTDRSPPELKENYDVRLSPESIAAVRPFA